MEETITLLELEKRICKEKNLSYEEYQIFLKEKFPDIDAHTEMRKEYPTDEKWARYKVSLFSYYLGVTHLAKNKLNLEFNNPDIGHMKICIDVICKTAKKFVFIIPSKDGPIIGNDIGLVRVSTGGYTGKVFKI
jgi:hypothetical protein